MIWNLPSNDNCKISLTGKETIEKMVSAEIFINYSIISSG
jgi:hypothetical protein